MTIDFCFMGFAVQLHPATIWEARKKSTLPTTLKIIDVDDLGAPGSTIRIGAPRGSNSFKISFNRSFIILEYFTRIYRVCLAEEGSSDSMTLLYM